MAKGPVRIAAVAAAAGFLLQTAFQGAIALGLRWDVPRGAEPTKGNSLWVLGSQAASRCASTCSSR